MGLVNKYITSSCSCRRINRRHVYCGGGPALIHLLWTDADPKLTDERSFKCATYTSMYYTHVGLPTLTCSSSACHYFVVCPCSFLFSNQYYYREFKYQLFSIHMVQDKLTKKKHFTIVLHKIPGFGLILRPMWSCVIPWHLTCFWFYNEEKTSFRFGMLQITLPGSCLQWDMFPLPVVLFATVLFLCWLLAYIIHIQCTVTYFGLVHSDSLKSKWG